MFLGGDFIDGEGEREVVEGGVGDHLSAALRAHAGDGFGQRERGVVTAENDLVGVRDELGRDAVIGAEQVFDHVQIAAGVEGAEDLGAEAVGIGEQLGAA